MNLKSERTGLAADADALMTNDLQQSESSMGGVVSGHMGSEEQCVPASTPTEIAIMDIWRSLLDKENFGVHDNFFKLGGHSLLVVKMRKHISERFGQKIAIQKVFELPTVNQLSTWVDEFARAAKVQNAVDDGGVTGEELTI